jgi:hypothetical protein
MILSGVEVPDGYYVSRTPECTEQGCICREHAVVRTEHEHLQAAAMRRKDTASSIANRRIAARKRAKLTPEQAKEIREASGTLKEIGAQYGVAFQTVSRIKRDIMWKQAATNPFAGLMG